MNRTVALLVGGAMALSACSGGSSEPDIPADYNTSVDDPAQPAEDIAESNPQALEIGVMETPDTGAYCMLMQASQEFDFDDRDTWRFVFLTDIEGDAPSAHIKINDEVLTFSDERRTEDAEGIETWRYRSEERGILVELQLRDVDAGPEYTEYEGTMAIIEPIKTEKMGIKGSCGV